MFIYEPRGKAREYSPLALNVYTTCTHKCKYCYAPNCTRRSAGDYFVASFPRHNLLGGLQRELLKNVPQKQVLLSFIGDPYCEALDRNEATREVLKLSLSFGVPVAILTKGGSRCLRDIDIFKQFGSHIAVGASLTFDNDKDSKEWEDGAALPEERLAVLEELHKNGVRTFASFEPVIFPQQSLNLMKKALDFLDVYKVGKLNNFNGLDKQINWTDFLSKTVALLRKAGKPFYIKHDLRLSAPSVHLYGKEVLCDEHNVA